MNTSFGCTRRIGVAGSFAAGALWTGATLAAEERGLAEQILRHHGSRYMESRHFRLVHAKGVVCEGTFTPSKGAANLSKAVLFQGASVPVTVRFSDGAPDPYIPDGSPNAGPRGLAIRFNLPGGGETRSSRCRITASSWQRGRKSFSLFERHPSLLLYPRSRTHGPLSFSRCDLSLCNLCRRTRWRLLASARLLQ